MQLARAVLHMDTFKTVENLTALLHSLVPTAPLQLQGPAFVQEEWDCTEHLHYLQGILQLPNRVEVPAHYLIGRYINALAAVTQQKLGAIVQICNTVERKQVEEYHAMLTTCECMECCAEVH